MGAPYHSRSDGATGVHEIGAAAIMRPGEGWNLGRERALLATRALRPAIVPACAATAVAVWAVGSRAVLGRALVIAAEEAWAASVVIGALRRRLRERPAARR